MSPCFLKLPRQLFCYSGEECISQTLLWALTAGGHGNQEPWQLSELWVWLQGAQVIFQLQRGPLSVLSRNPADTPLGKDQYGCHRPCIEHAHHHWWYRHYQLGIYLSLGRRTPAFISTNSSELGGHSVVGSLCGS